jgi:hypothetical protein
MHNNARPHTAKHTQKWLKDNAIEVMEWPPYSPDLNPIENLGFLLKEAIYKLRPDILTMTSEDEILETLVDTAPRAWEAIKDRVLHKLAESMLHRLEAVEKAEGWYTKY